MTTPATDFRSSLVAELRTERATVHFWVVVAYQSVPVFGVVFLAWSAAQIGMYFIIQSWLMLSLYAATDLTFNPRYLDGKAPPRGSTGLAAFIKMLFATLLVIGVLFAVAGAFVSYDFFRWNLLVEPTFLPGLAALTLGCLSTALRYVRSLPHRTPAQIEADDLRIATTFYRVLLLFFASFFVNFFYRLGIGIGDALFVLAISLILIGFEALPRSAALLLGKKPA